MGCGLSIRPSMHEKMKLENGYLKGPYIGSRRSTGLSDFRQDPGRVNNHIRNTFGGQWNVKEENSVLIKNGTIESKNSSINVDYENDNNVSKYSEEDDTDRWPKWLTNIVPKSDDSYIKIDKIGHGTYSNVYKARDKDRSDQCDPTSTL